MEIPKIRDVTQFPALPTVRGNIKRAVAVVNTMAAYAHRNGVNGLIYTSFFSVMKHTNYQIEAHRQP